MAFEVDPCSSRSMRQILISYIPQSRCLCLTLCKADVCLLWGRCLQARTSYTLRGGSLLCPQDKYMFLAPRAMPHIPSLLRKWTLYPLYMLWDTDLVLFFWSLICGSSRSGLRILSLIQSSIPSIPYQVRVHVLDPNRVTLWVRFERLLEWIGAYLQELLKVLSLS